MKERIIWGVVASCLAVGLVGCREAKIEPFVMNAKVQELDPKLQQQVRDILVEHTGTAIEPKMLGDDEFDPDRLKLGRAVYLQRCVQCHGFSGDGNGEVAQHMYPRPRDYRRGIFKFTSTPYGAKPRRDDLILTVTRGIRGTSMPTFKLLPKDEIEAVVDYVLMLTHRGELEEQLAYEADVEETIDPDYVPDFIQEIHDRWARADSQEVHPLTNQPILTTEHVAAGRKAFLSRGCSKCHGEDGRGQTKENIGKDTWGFPTKAADLTSGMLHGGQRPLDVYRRIVSGINGTPMPGFKNALASEPETIWNLVAFVLHTSDQRRVANREKVDPSEYASPGPLPKPGTNPESYRADTAGDDEAAGEG